MDTRGSATSKFCIMSFVQAYGGADSSFFGTKFVPGKIRYEFYRFFLAGVAIPLISRMWSQLADKVFCLCESLITVI